MGEGEESCKLGLKVCQKVLKKNVKQGTIKIGRNWF